MEQFEPPQTDVLEQQRARWNTTEIVGAAALALAFGVARRPLAEALGHGVAADVLMVGAGVAVGSMREGLSDTSTTLRESLETTKEKIETMKENGGIRWLGKRILSGVVEFGSKVSSKAIDKFTGVKGFTSTTSEIVDEVTGIQTESPEHEKSKSERTRKIIGGIGSLAVTAVATYAGYRAGMPELGTQVHELTQEVVPHYIDDGYITADELPAIGQSFGNLGEDISMGGAHSAPLYNPSIELRSMQEALEKPNPPAMAA